MKTIHWIIILAVAVGGYLIWTFREKIPFIAKTVTKNVPDKFIRNDGMGTVTWEKLNGEYFYTLDYGIVGGIKQKSTLENFMKAYKS